MNYTQIKALLYDTEWVEFLDPFLKFKSMGKIIHSIKKEAKSGKTIYPSPKKMFKCFNYTPYKKLKLVVLGQDPYANNKATGIAFANEDLKNNILTKLSPSLIKILDAIEEDTGNIFVDYSFQEVSYSGVLLLNAALTVEKGNYGSHLNLWKPFTEYIIKNLDEKNKNIVFCFLGNKAQYFSKFVHNNTIIKETHPSFAVRNNTDWGRGLFLHINKKLKENGHEEVKW